MSSTIQPKLSQIRIMLRVDRFSLVSKKGDLLVNFVLEPLRINSISISINVLSIETNGTNPNNLGWILNINVMFVH